MSDNTESSSAQNSSSIESIKDSLWGSEPISSIASSPPSAMESVVAPAAPVPESIPRRIIRRKKGRIPAPAAERGISSGESTFSKESWDNQTDIKRAIYEFYKLKEKYEKNKAEFKDYLRSAKQKKIKNLKQKKPKCVKCGRDVGNVFIVDNKQFLAKCGDANSPCQLNILIQKELQVTLYTDYIAELKRDIEENKKKIILNKLKLLFGYKSESQALKDVENEINDFDGNNILYQSLQTKYKDVTMSEERLEDLKRLHNEIEQYISEIQYMSNPPAAESSTPNIDTKRIAEIYVNDLIPRVKSLREKKYDVVDYVDDKLYQYPISLEKNEIIDKEDNTHIVSFFI